MSLASGTRLGTYEILGVLGAGGMGEVYRARDTKLGRDVAIKILPSVLHRRSGSPRALRTRGAAARGAQPPHIGAIYGFEDRDGVHALVLELVEGETLAHARASRVQGRPTAFPIARRSPSPGRWLRRSRRRTSAASCIAI